jgi:hypothetical protein
MSKFKPDDVVVCVNDALEGNVQMGGLTKGKTYTVRGTSMSGTVNLQEIAEVYWYREERFEAAVPATKDEQTIATMRKEINDLKHENSQQKATIASARNLEDALVARLHRFAEQQEDAGSDDVADEIDDILDSFDLPTRKKTYEMVFTVPVQVRVSDIKATGPNKVREMWEAGEINWNVADYEDQSDDDIKVIEIAEVDHQ